MFLSSFPVSLPFFFSYVMPTLTMNEGLSCFFPSAIVI